MPRKREDSIFLNRYTLSTTVFRSIKKDLRKLHKEATALLQQGIIDKKTESFVKEVQKLTLRNLEDLRSDSKQFK